MFTNKIKAKLVPVSQFVGNKAARPMVSVCVGTYNQKEYVSQCLDSILNQLVDFKVEILVNDDASTDGTRELLLDYQKKYPDIIKLFLQKENQFQKEKKYSSVYRIHSSRIQGKYVSLCDSDDYYCDNLCLYKKVKLLEKYKDCNACYSRVKKLNNDNMETISLMPKFCLASGKISSKKMIKMFVKNYCFQTSSYFFKAKHYIDFCENYPVFAEKINVFDEPIVMYFGAIGKVCYINEVFSIYRKFSNNSWSSSKKNTDKEQMTKLMLQRIDYLNEFDKFSNYKFHKSCKWGVLHAESCIHTNDGNLKYFLKNKEFRKFYRKRYFKNYIKVKYFSTDDTNEKKL